MRAGEWQFLCAVHDAPKSCCAIDYCCHTLDWATNIVTNPKIFPSRFVVDAHDKNTALKNLVNVFRRLHRIFAHAWFQHRGVFWSVEGQGGLYVFFKTVCDVYDLLPAENYKLPPEAEGLDSNSGAADLGDRGDRRQQPQPQLLGPISIVKPPAQREGEDGDYSSVNRTNTRRHIKSSPSTGSAVTTVPEADEDDGSDLSHRLRGMRISAPPSVAEDERESANIPVIVEHKPLTAADHPVRPPSVIPPPGAEGDEGQPKQEQAPEVVIQEAETPGPEHEFAAEPEAPAQTLSDSASEPKPEHRSEPEPEAEAQPAAPAEEKQSQPDTVEEPAPESEEASGEPDPVSSPAAAADSVTEPDAGTVEEQPEAAAGASSSYPPLTDGKKAAEGSQNEPTTTESESASGPDPDLESQATATTDAPEKVQTEAATPAGEDEDETPSDDDAKTEADTTATEEQEEGAEEKPADGTESTEEKKKPSEEKGD
jgi:hypothetical protein